MYQNSVNLYVCNIQDPKLKGINWFLDFEEKILFLIQTNARNLR